MQEMENYSNPCWPLAAMVKHTPPEQLQSGLMTLPSPDSLRSYAKMYDDHLCFLFTGGTEVYRMDTQRVKYTL